MRRVFCLTPLVCKPVELRNARNLFACPATEVHTPKHGSLVLTVPACPATEVHTPKHGSLVLTVPASYPSSLNRNFGRFLTRRYSYTSQNTVFVWFWNIFRAKRYVKRCAPHGVHLCQLRRHKTRAACRPALWLTHWGRRHLNCLNARYRSFWQF